MSSFDKPHSTSNKGFGLGRGGAKFKDVSSGRGGVSRGGNSGQGGGSFRGGNNGRGRGSYIRGGESRPGGYSKTGTVYEGKREKLKARRNYASKVKSDYVKQLHKLEATDDFTKTPDFYQEIFAEVDRENARNPLKAKFSFGSNVSSGSVPEHSGSESNSEHSGSESDSEHSGSHSVVSPKRHSEAPSGKEGVKETKANVVEHKPKPNPFKRSIEELEKQQQELDAIRKEAKLAKEKALKEKLAKKRQRKAQTTKLLRRTKSGQPILANHLDHILSKLQKP